MCYFIRDEYLTCGHFGPWRGSFPCMDAIRNSATMVCANATQEAEVVNDECDACINERRRLLDEAIRRDEAAAEARQLEQQAIEQTSNDDRPRWRARARATREQLHSLQQRALHRRAEEERLRDKVRARRSRQLAQDSNRASRGSM